MRSMVARFLAKRMPDRRDERRIRHAQGAPDTDAAACGARPGTTVTRRGCGTIRRCGWRRAPVPPRPRRAGVGACPRSRRCRGGWRPGRLRRASRCCARGCSGAGGRRAARRTHPRCFLTADLDARQRERRREAPGALPQARQGAVPPGRADERRRPSLVVHVAPQEPLLRQEDREARETGGPLRLQPSAPAGRWASATTSYMPSASCWSA